MLNRKMPPSVAAQVKKRPRRIGIGQDEGRYVVNEQIGYLLRVAMQRHKAIFTAMMVDDLTQTQFATLAKLFENGPTSQNLLGRLIALDAKVNFDDNAMFRHKDFLALRDLNEEEPLEIEASKFDLNYIKLDGNIACMVNGAGLAMATMDIIKLYGGEPANFLDVGGGADKETVAQAFRILLADSRVRGLLINIFGGIMRCDVLAQGVVDAARELQVAVPLVVRMQGTNVEQGRKILADSGLTIISAETMSEAAEKVVKAVA